MQNVNICCVLRLALGLFLFSGAVASQASTGSLASARFLLAQPNASAPAELLPRRPFEKPSRDLLVERQHDDRAILKFTDGTGIRLRGRDFVILDSELDPRRLEIRGVTKSTLALQLARVNDLLQRKGTLVKRLLTAPEDILAGELRSGESRCSHELPDLNLFFDLRFPGKTSADVVDILDELDQLELVEYAAPKVQLAPPPTDIDPPTPNFSVYQTYFAAAPEGIDVPYARLLPGGRGEGIRVVDVEDGWIAAHEDFPQLVSPSGFNHASYQDHGTATIGEIAAVENLYGMTGIAPSVEVTAASPFITANTFSLPDSIQRAIDQSRVGDVIFIEQQTYYNYPTDISLCPTEWDTEAFSVIEVAVANGRVVVEAAANGSQNLDDTLRFGQRFNRTTTDSGAIFVGAGRSSDHAPLPFSNYGSRVDVQGWGEDVATLGYGALFFPNSDVRQAYTAGFNGTSSATPIVTGAAVLLQAIRGARGLPSLTSTEMRSALQVGATPQAPGVHIGPLPDLRDAIAAIPLAAPTITATGSGNGSVTVTWGAQPGVSGYEVFRKDTQTAIWNFLGATSAAQLTDTGLTPGKTYAFHVRSYDGAGNRSVDSNTELATTIDFTNGQLTTSTPILAKHLVEVRTAVNAICTYAEIAICPSLPFAGAALDENEVRTGIIKASDFTEVQNQIALLRSLIGASPAIFRETPAVGDAVRIIHMEDLRSGAN